MRYLIIYDNGDLNDFVIREDNTTMYVRGMLRILASPHKEECRISSISYADCENEPSAEPWMFDFIDGIGANSLSPEEFNKLWDIADPITGNG